MRLVFQAMWYMVCENKASVRLIYNRFLDLAVMKLHGVGYINFGEQWYDREGIVYQVQLR